MINEIIEAISVALHKEFGDAYEIHMEQIEQGLEEPCFFIQCLNPADELIRGQKHSRRSQFCIQYFPTPGSGSSRECYDVADRLSSSLEYIHAGRAVRGTGRNARMVDGVLHFFVNYNCIVCRSETGLEAMDGFIPHTTVKEDGQGGETENGCRSE